jgi:hypothetical protein
MADSTPSPSNHSRPKKLLDQVRDAICLLPAHRGKLCPLGQTFFHDKRHLNDMGRLEIEAFLTHLATHEHVAVSTQNQALGECCSSIATCSTATTLRCSNPSTWRAPKSPPIFPLC